MSAQQFVLTVLRHSYFVITCSFLFFLFSVSCFLSPASAAADHQIVIKQSGTVTFDGQSIPDALHLTSDQELVIVQIVTEPTEALGTVLATLEIPAGANPLEEPRLRPSRCACHPTITRLESRTYQLSITNVTAGARVSLEVAFPPGTFQLSAGQQVVISAKRLSPWLLGLALVLLAGSLVFLGRMVHELREIRKFKLQTSETNRPPNDVRAAIVSLIPSGKITAATLAAMLIDLAERGFLTIINKGETFIFAEDHPLDLSGPGFALGSVPGATTSQEEIDKAKKEGLTIAEKFLLAKLFTTGSPTVSREELKVRLGRRLSSWKIGKVYAELYKEVTAAGYFIRNPHQIHLHYRLAGISIFFTGLLGFIGSFFLPGDKLVLLLVWVALALNGYIITRMVPYLPLLTVTGQAEWVRWSGFRSYLSNPVVLDPKVPTKDFFTHLPYALAFDTVAAWAARFDGRRVVAPSWYLTEPREKPVKEMASEVSYLVKFVAALLASIHEHTVQ